MLKFEMEDKLIKSKFILATLVLFVLISLTCVSATDGNQTDAVATDNESVACEIATDQSDVNDDEILGDEDMPGTFENLQQELNGSEEGSVFKLQRDYKYQ